jgi:hypothetical protein
MDYFSDDVTKSGVFFPLKHVLTYRNQNGFTCSSSKNLLGVGNYNKSQKKSSSEFSPQFDRIHYPQLLITLHSPTVHSQLFGQFATHLVPYGISMLCEIPSIRNGWIDIYLLQWLDTASLVNQFSTFADYCLQIRDVISDCRRTKSKCTG